MLHDINWWWAEFWGTFMMVFILLATLASEHTDNTFSTGQGRHYLAWGILACVVVPVSMFGKISGMFNPAVLLGKYIAGVIPWSDFMSKGLPEMAAQLLGAMLAALALVPYYWEQFKSTRDGELVNATFVTSPTRRNLWMNGFQEGMSTFILMFGVLGIEKYAKGTPTMLLALTLGILVVGVVFLGSQTSPAINPARDLGPRIILSIMPVPNKMKVDWGYALVPILGPIAGAAVAALAFRFLIVGL